MTLNEMRNWMVKIRERSSGIIVNYRYTIVQETYYLLLSVSVKLGFLQQIEDYERYLMKSEKRQSRLTLPFDK